MMQKALPGMALPPMEQPLDRKIELAIKLLQGYEEMALQLSPDGFYLAFSGGKDSIVIKELANMAGVRYKAWYNQTTIDPPELVYFIQRHHADVEWSRAKRNLCLSIADHAEGPPTRLRRWCCAEYKEAYGNGGYKIIGVRAAESPRRAKTWRPLVANKNTGYVLCPILYWSDADIWAFVRQQGLPYCSLYDEGFDRLGCIGCPMKNEAATKKDFERWPGFERLWKMGIKKFYDKFKGVPRRDGKARAIETFETFEIFWNWWISRKGQAGDECQTSLLFSGGDDEQM